MIKYLETFIGDVATKIWNDFKKGFPRDYEALVAKGANPHNFLNMVGQILTAKDPNLGSTVEQERAAKALEQISLKSYDEAVPFLKEYIGLTATSQNSFDETLSDRLVKKLPGAIGDEIQKEYEKWKPSVKGTFGFSVSSTAAFVNERLQDICQKVNIHQQIKNSDYKFCRNIVVPTIQFGKEECHGACTKKTKHKKYPSRRKYYIRQSSQKKPFLNKGHHVRKFYPNRDYKSIKCYICGEPGHTARNCRNKVNRDDKHTQLVDTVQMDLLHIDEEMGDDESIYSIVSESDNHSMVSSSEIINFY